MPRKVSAPSSLEINLLGLCRISVDGRLIEETRWPWRNAKLLVKLLALQPHHQLHREQIMERLRPETDTEHASDNLNRTLYYARGVLEPRLSSPADSHFIQSQWEQIVLTAPRKLWIDVEEF